MKIQSIRRMCTLFIAMMAILAVAASCGRQAEYETILQFNGVAGQTVSNTFTISGTGQAELMLLTDAPPTGLDISLYQAGDETTPVMQANWILTGDSFDDIAPGQYYLSAQMEDINVPATIASSGFLIEVRDYTD